MPAFLFRLTLTLILIAATEASAVCVPLKKLCDPTAPPDGKLACCAGLTCVKSSGYHCEPEGGATTTTTTTKTTTTKLGTTTTTTVSDGAPPTSTSLPDPYAAKYPPVHATARDVNIVVTKGKFDWFHGHAANQAERASLQGEMVTLYPEMGRYLRRNPYCAGWLHVVDGTLSVIGKRFMTSTQYEGRVFPPKSDPWEIILQGAGNMYDMYHSDSKKFRECSLSNNPKNNCAETITQNLLDAWDMHIADGRCVEGSPNRVYVPTGKEAEVWLLQKEQTHEGIITGDLTFAPLDPASLAALEATGPAHMAGMTAVCDPDAPKYTGPSVDAAHDAYESLATTANEQHRRRMPEFPRVADTEKNKHPLDPPGTKYWTPEEECSLRKMQDIVHMAWLACHKDVKCTWGQMQKLARLHEFLHDCMAYYGEYEFRFPPMDPTMNTEKVEPSTCQVYLAAYSTTGKVP